MRVFLELYQFVCVSSFPYEFEGGMWELIVLVHDHCLSFYCEGIVDFPFHSVQQPFITSYYSYAQPAQPGPNRTRLCGPCIAAIAAIAGD